METIDLDLPSGTLWGTCNIGANNITEFGFYFAWGDIYSKSNYRGMTCATYDLNLADLRRNDYTNIYNELSKECDVAYQRFGSEWRIPSAEQSKELIDNCNWEWKENFEDSGVNGILGVSKSNGQQIFLPAAGYKVNEQLVVTNDRGCYWTSTPNYTASNRAWSINFDYKIMNTFNHGLRYEGFSIRPIFRK